MNGETILEQPASRGFVYFDQKDYLFTEELYARWWKGEITSFRMDGRYEGDIACLFAFVTENPCDDFWLHLPKIQEDYPEEKNRKKQIKPVLPQPIAINSKQLEKFTMLFCTFGYKKHYTFKHLNYYYHVALLQKEDGTTETTKNKYRAKRRYLDYHSFDSHDEALYYLSLLEWQRNGVVQSFRLQPRYLLQEAFEKNGKSYEKIEYVADFEVLYTDGHLEVCDTKGLQTTDFKIKQKWFEATYAHLSIRLLKYSKQKGWYDIDEKPVKSNYNHFKKRRRG